jgi:glycerol-3-phosphate O-acyltransferase 3/4
VLTWPLRRLIQMLCSVFVMSWSGVIRFHGVRPVAKPGKPPGIFVANHSSMIDFIVLQQSHNYAVVGQKHTGWIAFFQDRILGVLDCIWFDRSDTDNKALVANRLEEHAHDPARVPILVFPEGTCVNNKYVIMFRKTVFDLDVPINPIAIRYNDVFIPGYWNSRRVSFAGHLMALMTSWAVVCDVWYMDPMTRREGESAIDFAKRVQNAIARRGGLKAVDWDGYMKYWSPSARFIRGRRRMCAEYLLSECRLRGGQPSVGPGLFRSQTAPSPPSMAPTSHGLSPPSILGTLVASSGAPTETTAVPTMRQAVLQQASRENVGLGLEELE